MMMDGGAAIMVGDSTMCCTQKRTNSKNVDSKSKKNILVILEVIYYVRQGTTHVMRDELRTKTEERRK